MKKNRITPTAPSYQSLERRQMLAGDVLVSLEGATLTIQGDVDDNQILIRGEADGSATITGLDGTTINGGTAPFSAAAGLSTAVVDLEAGNDELEIFGLVLERSLTVRTGAGNDQISFEQSNVRGYSIDSGAGDDVLEFDNVFSRDTIAIQTGDGSDTIGIGAVAADDDGLIDTGNGDDFVAIDNLGIREDLDFLLGAGDDQVLIAGESYAYRADIDLGNGNDDLSILPATNDAAARFRQRLTISGDDGNDTVVLDASVDSESRTRIDGDSGTDTIVEGEANLNRSRIRDFELTEVDDLNAQLDAFYTSISNNGIDDVARFGGPSDDDGGGTDDGGTDNGGTDDGGADDGGTDDGGADDGGGVNVSTEPLLGDRDAGPIAIDETLTLAGDSGELVTGATVEIVGFQPGEETLLFTDTPDIEGTFAAGILTLTGDATLEDYQAALQSVTYDITTTTPTTGDRTLEFNVDFDDTNLDSLTGSRTVTVIGDELLNATNSDLTITAGAAATAIDPTVLFRGNSDTLVSNATVVIQNFQSGEDILAFNDIGTITGNIVTDATNETATLALTGEGTVQQYQAALRSVTFQTSADTTDLTRTATFTVDTDENTLSDSRTISILPTVSTDPVLSVSTAPLLGDRDAGPILIDDALTLTGADDVVVSGATVQIVGFQAGEETLIFNDTADIEGTFTNGTLTLAGNATLEAYQAALRSVTRDNLTIAPSTADRTLQYTVNFDDAALDSLTGSRDITIVAEEFLNATNSDLAITSGAAATEIDDNVQFRGNSDTQVTDATVVIQNFQSGDLLAFDDFGPITGNVVTNATNNTATLTLTGAGTVGDYQRALRLVTFQDTANTSTSSTRTAVFSVNTAESTLTDSRTISILPTLNTNPVLAVSSTPLLGDRDAGPILIDDTLTLTGADDVIVSGASVVIDGFQSGEETLQFNDTADIEGIFSGGTLTLTGDATLEDYQAALRSVTYDILSIAPSTTNRTLLFTVNFDDTALDSLTGSRDITIVAEEFLNATNSDLAITSGAAATEIDDNVQFRGNSDTQVTDATVVIQNFQSGDLLAFDDIGPITGNVVTDATNNTATLTLTGAGTVGDYQRALRLVTFQDTANTSTSSTRTAVFSVNTAESALTDSRTISVLPTLNADPVLAVSTAPLLGDRDGGPILIDDALTLTGADDVIVSGASVVIDGFQPDEEILIFNDTADIEGSFVDGTLTLTGDATLEAYQAALRSVTRDNLTIAPSTADRTLQFTVNFDDANLNSLTGSRDITIVAEELLNAVPTSTIVAGGDETIIDPQIQFRGNSDTQVSGATVEVQNFQSDDDILEFDEFGPFDADFAVDEINNILVLSITGNATVQQYQTALRSVAFQNTSDSIASSTRQVIFTVTTSENVLTDNLTITVSPS